MAKKLLTEKDILDAVKQGKKTLFAGKDTVLTPAAKDAVRQYGITLTDKEEKPKPSAQQSSPQNYQSSPVSQTVVGGDLIVIGSDHGGYKTKEMLKKYLAEINAYKLGLRYFPVLLKFQNTIPAIEKEIIAYLSKQSSVVWLTLCEGNWDINMTLCAKSYQEINLFFLSFLEQYSEYIAEKQIFITTEIHYFKRGFWLGKPTQSIVSTGTEDVLNVDNVDIQLLSILSTHARMSLVELAQHLHLTPKIIAYKIKKLKKQNILQGSRIFVDYSKLGYAFYKTWFSLQKMNATEWKKLLTYIHSLSNIVWATKLIGYYDFSIEMECTDKEFRKILFNIKEHFSPFLKKHESLLIFEEIEMNYMPLHQ